MPRRETALVIDDDQELRSLLSDMLHDAGFDVVQCSRGADGVAAVTRHSPLVVTLDIGLPDMDGFETLRRIRSRSSCYVMMISGRDDEMDLLSSLQLGADEYITKPFRIRELRARIHAMLRRPRVADLPPALSAGPGEAPRHGAQDTPPPTEPGQEGRGADHRGGRAGEVRDTGGARDAGAMGAVTDSGPAAPMHTGPRDARPVSEDAGQRSAQPWRASPGNPGPRSSARSAGASVDAGGDDLPVYPGYHRVPPGPSPAARRGVLSHLGLVLDPAGREVTAEGSPVQLTRMEFDLLHELMRAGGAVMTKHDLVQALRGDEQAPGAPSDYVSTADEHALEVHMGNLRRKLGERRGSPRWVMTVRGVGYRLTPRPPGH